MGIPLEQLRLDELSYTYVDPHTGANVHIASQRLRQWCLDNRRNLYVERTPVSVKMAQQFITDNVVSLKRLKQMTVLNLEEPIIFAYDGSYTNGLPDAYLVDGHHRFVFAALGGITLIKAWMLKLEQWQPFIIDGIPDNFYTEQQLRDQPVYEKPYWKK